MRIHFIAVGGSAMHNLAIALHLKGYDVTGSDDHIFEPSKSRLNKHGLLPDDFGWDTSRISDDLDFVILGMHAKVDNPELIESQNRNLKIVSYPEFIYEMSKNKTRVVIGGSHGKTSITAMVLHVLNQNGKEVDFMVGAQLEGFETMVHLTDENDFILLEGDEYLSSPIDRRPKFHLYKPNIALLSGISWDHINVFPTKEIYLKQFELFLETMVSGGVLVYNKLDSQVNQISIDCKRPIRKLEYTMPDYYIDNGISFLRTDEGDLPLKIFGDHNLSNLSGAKLICQLMGVQEEEFNNSISSFKGADKRLESILVMMDRNVFKDFAHSPSKVIATVKALKNQYQNRKLIALLELHTFSSLNKEFIVEYKDSLKSADIAVLFYDPKAIKNKGLSAIDDKMIKKAFNDNKLIVFSNSGQLSDFLLSQSYVNANLLIMSSGNYASLDLDFITSQIKISE
ncbi:MAG: peptidoglycan synthetase [Flavobacteriaceae bacterium]|nr:peptidoglycan synthetase [Flavobacteriaceae bacterium]MBT3754050.1 peptidoglycan synthetase [Flavobacteriaceae bacterium]MBT3794546.1 peptidoglycan synthetase [Flavobacteriaceae bacterium]MBT4246810.1 peptidoglycan synthetase [Flavobacteriaceae bacterium]MBT5395739.1 peptidoglycan synthetase [Flavobacteriaceae bacterium]